MKKYLWILAAAFLLQACSKDEEEGPYVPWRPGDDKEETIDLDKATKVMILTEQAKNRIVMIDQPTGKVAWEWTAADSGLSAAEQAWFDLPDEAKPVYNRTCVLVTASGGGVALIRIADKKAMFYAKPGGNPHSAEVLPDGNVVVASSTGNLLSVYVYNGADSYVSRPAFTMPVHSAHNVVWDRKRGCLWTATGAQLLKLAYNGKRTAPELTQVRSYDMAAGNTDAHDPGARLRGGCDVCIDESACLQVRLCGGEVPRRGDLPAEHHQEHFDGSGGVFHDRHAPHVGREQLVVGRGVRHEGQPAVQPRGLPDLQGPLVCGESVRVSRGSHFVKLKMQKR